MAKTKPGAKLTSIEALAELHDQFKIACIQDGFSTQRLFNRSMHLYLTNPEFRSQVRNHFELRISGSTY